MTGKRTVFTLGLPSLAPAERQMSGPRLPAGVLGAVLVLLLAGSLVSCVPPAAEDGHPTKAPRGFEAAPTAEDRIRTAAPEEFEAWDAAIAAHKAARDRLRAAVPAEFAAWRAAEGEAVSANVELEVADAGWADPEDAVGRRAWEKAAERIKITDAALEAAEEWLQESAPVEFAAFQAADAEMRAAALRATVEALRAAAPAEFAALEGLNAALEAAGEMVREIVILARNEDVDATETDTTRAFDMARAKRDTLWEARKRALERLQAAAPVEFAAWDQARRAVE